MPDIAMGMSPEPPIENLLKPGDPSLATKEDQLKQCGDPVPIGRGEPPYTDRNEVRSLPPMEASVEVKMAHTEQVIEAIMEGQTGSLGCQGDPDCMEPFSPPSDIPFGDILAEETCDGSPTPSPRTRQPIRPTT